MAAYVFDQTSRDLPGPRRAGSGIRVAERDAEGTGVERAGCRVDAASGREVIDELSN